MNRLIFFRKTNVLHCWDHAIRDSYSESIMLCMRKFFFYIKTLTFNACLHFILGNKLKVCLSAN